ncbi:hypothetical protein LTR85_012236 [Meristemomyces frigidus]|nr:hypothetical protein LTR85_012236 [Meristemomyces frigidus]
MKHRHQANHGDTDAIPGAKLWAKVDKRLGVPMWSLVLVTVVQMLLGLIDLGSTSAFTAFVSVGVQALALAYAIPIAISLFCRRSEVIRAKWNLGQTVGTIVNVVALLWIAFELVLFSMPTALPVTDVSMNYSSVVLVGFGAIAAVCFFPPKPEGLTIKQIERHPGLSISYKQTYICETRAKAWAGYVNMPSTYLTDVQDPSDPYNISTFFWYFEARHEPENAPTAIYLAGGPGQSSMYGAAEDGGPCSVLPDSNSTVENPWSWNEYVNMLYVDQPNGIGFSYDELFNSTVDQLFLGGDPTDTGIVPFDAYNGTVPEANSTFFWGTFPSQSFNRTANSTALDARTLWHFSQAWFTGFPEWNTCNKKISVWGNSYGGFTVPTFAARVQEQNVKIWAGDLNDSKVLELDTIGIANGCIDLLYQASSYLDMAYNNTYGLQVINKTIYELGKHDWEKSGGCRDLLLACRGLGDQYDPEQLSINATVNEVCVEAELYCSSNVLGLYDIYSNRSDFDIAAYKPDPTPQSYIIGWLNQPWVQQSLGVAVNFTADSTANQNVMLDISGDAARTAGMKSVEYLLDSGIKVALVYGDRDYRCPWLATEALSLQANWTGADNFREAGYQHVHTNDTYDGAVVRQHGLLSFSRVFDAAHDTAWFQPETVSRIFNRVMFDKDVATGRLSTKPPFSNYTTHGPSSSFHIKNKLPSPPPAAACYLYYVGPTCTEDQYRALVNGTAEIVDFSIVTPAGGGGPVSSSSGGVF